MALMALVAALGPVGCRGTPEDHEASVRALLAEGRVDESLVRLRALLDEDPEQPALQMLYAEVLMRLGDFQLAVWPLRSARESSELEVPAGVALARSYAEIQSWDDSVAAAGTVLEIEPEHRVALELRAQSLLATKHEEEALLDIDRLVALDPDAVAPRILKLRALLTLEREEEAEAALRELRTSMTRAEASEAVRARYCGVEATFTRERGEVEEANRLFDDCLERFPADPTLLREALRVYGEQGRGDELVPLFRRGLEARPASGGVREGLAALLRDKGEIEAAEQVLIEGTELPESGPGAWLDLYEHYWRAEEWWKARDALAHALQLTPEVSTTHALMYADALVLAGDYERAEEIAADLAPGYRELVLARSLEAQGDPRGALPLLEESFKRWPGNATARWLAGRCHEQLGEIESALAQYVEAFRNEESQKAALRTDAALRIARIQLAAGAPESALSFVANYVEKVPKDPSGYQVAARVFARTNQAAQLASALQGLERLAGQRALARSLQAEHVAEVRGTQAAVTLVEEAGIDLLDPENARLLDTHLGHLVAIGQAEKALALLDTAISADPERGTLHAFRGRTLERAGASDEARAAFERALELDPGQVVALMGRARLAEREGDAVRAIAFYDRARQADPSSPDAAIAAARLVADLPERRVEAETRLDRVLREHALRSDAVILLSRLLLEDGRELERAEALALRGVRFGGEEGRALEAAELLGRIQLERGNTQAALETLRRVVEREAAPSSARYQLGMALLAAGEREEGERSLRAALEAGEFEQAARARELLAGLDSAGEGVTP